MHFFHERGPSTLLAAVAVPSGPVFGNFGPFLARFGPAPVKVEPVPLEPAEPQCGWKTRTLGRKMTAKMVIYDHKTLPRGYGTPTGRFKISAILARVRPFLMAVGASCGPVRSGPVSSRLDPRGRMAGGKCILGHSGAFWGPKMVV